MFNEIISRRSVKKYKSDNVPDEIINKIIEAGLNAPSAMNMQSPIILCIKDKETRDKVESLNSFFASGRYEGHPFYNAPVVLIVLVPKSANNGIYDGSLCMGNMLNAAYSLGVGACWIHRAREVFETEEGKAILEKAGIVGEYVGVGNCIVGYPDDYSPKEKVIKEGRVYYI